MASSDEDKRPLTAAELAQLLRQLGEQVADPQLKVVFMQSAARLDIHWTTLGNMQLALDNSREELGKRQRRIIHNWLRRHGG